MEKSLYKGILDNNITGVKEMLSSVSIDKEVDIEIISDLIKSSEYNSWNIPCVAHLLPLHLACVCGHVSIVQLLLDNDADTNAVLDDEETALHFACLYGRVECAELLLRYNCDVNAQTRGDTALMLAVACYGATERCIKDVYFNIAQTLIEAGCDVNIGDNQGLVPLHLAAGKENSELLKLLIKAGADINVRCFNMPKTPLFCAVSAEIEENVKLLIEAGSNVNDVLFPGNTALSTALSNGSLGIVLDLLNAGASPLIRSDTLDIQMYMANKHYVMILVLLAYGLDLNWQNPYDKASLLVTATRQQCPAMVKLLLLKGADPEVDTRLGTTALWAAIKCNNLRLVKVFLRWNCDMDIFSLEFNPLIPMSPVQLAIVNGNKSICKELLYFGCELKNIWLTNEPIASRLNERKPFKNWLHDYRCRTHSLNHLCMVAIRKSVGVELPRKIRKLTLPSKLKRFIITGEM